MSPHSKHLYGEIRKKNIHIVWVKNALYQEVCEKDFWFSICLLSICTDLSTAANSLTDVNTKLTDLQTAITSLNNALDTVTNNLDTAFTDCGAPCTGHSNKPDYNVGVGVDSSQVMYLCLVSSVIFLNSLSASVLIEATLSSCGHGLSRNPNWYIHKRMTNQNVQSNRHGPQNKRCNQASADSKHYLVSKLRPPCP